MFKPNAKFESLTTGELVTELTEALELLAALAPQVGTGNDDCAPFDAAHTAVRSYARELAAVLSKRANA